MTSASRSSSPKALASSPKSQAQGTAPQVALVIDWLDQVGGAEQVLLAFHEIYPDAPIYTSVYRKKKIKPLLDDAEIKTGWINIFPDKLRRFLGPLRQCWFSHLDLSSYDLVISVTGAEGKSIKTKSKKHSAYHLCYCHVPTQYYWQLYDDYLKNPGFGLLDPLVRLGLKLFVKPLRKKDYLAAQRPDQIVTISKYAAAQISKYYNREATIINPPVDLRKFTREGTAEFSTTSVEKSTKETNNSGKSQISSKNKNQKSQINSTQNNSTKSAKSQISPLPNPVSPAASSNSVQSAASKSAFPRSGFITTSRQVSWKRLDLCIKACLETGDSLTIIGEGPEHENLVKLAQGSDLIQFFPRMSQTKLETFLRRAEGYLFPSKEPFGIAPVEALAAGCPVIALGEGGALDYIEPGKNGLLFKEQTVASLAQAIRDFKNLKFSTDYVKKSAARFDKTIFIKKIKETVADIKV